MASSTDICDSHQRRETLLNQQSTKLSIGHSMWQQFPLRREGVGLRPHRKGLFILRAARRYLRLSKETEFLIVDPKEFCVWGLDGGARAQATSDSADPPNQAALTQCAAQEYRAVDDKLGVVYKQLMAARPAPADREVLRDAERAWITYRDRECAFETAKTVGGSVHPMAVAGCLTEKTQAHLKELSNVLNCQEGDLSC